MSDGSPAPEPAAPAAPPAISGSPTDFLKGVVGKRVVVRLVSGVDYRGACAHTHDAGARLMRAQAC
jgi:U6 snRNA-associated Sm-like protein LSm6